MTGSITDQNVVLGLKDAGTDSLHHFHSGLFTTLKGSAQAAPAFFAACYGTTTTGMMEDGGPQPKTRVLSEVSKIPW